MLLLIGAGAADAASFNGIATHLADHYTVVSYDRRGYARSPLDHPEEEQRIETHSDDAHRLLAILSTEPAYVFGSSGGAKIGLDLAIRHPEQLHTLVAHEPPVMELLPEAERPVMGLPPDAGRPRTPLDNLQKFREILGVSYDDREPDAELPYESPETKARLAANRAFLVTHEATMYPRYTLDIVALSATPTRIVIAAGQASRGRFPHRVHPAGRASGNSCRGIPQPSCWLREPPKSIRRAVAQRARRGSWNVRVVSAWRKSCASGRQRQHEL